MLRITSVIFLCICCVQLLAGQEMEIAENEFIAKENSALDTIKKTNHRLVRTLEYFEDSTKPGRLAERHTDEVVLPDKWRKIEVTDDNGKKTREERIWDGSALYVKQNDREWERFSGGSSTGARIESGKVTKTYRFLGKSELDDREAQVYQVQSVRIANKFSATDMVVVKYIRDTRYWFDSRGRLLKKVEETIIEGRPEKSRETTTVEYDPKITIDAPIR